jgi:hypothetical protein
MAVFGFSRAARMPLGEVLEMECEEFLCWHGVAEDYFKEQEKKAKCPPT